MTIGGEYDTEEKAAIRERLWDCAFVDLIQNEGRRPEDIRCLCLPGAQCIYERHLVEQLGIEKRNIIAVEQYEEPFLSIHHFLGGKGITRHGLVEDLVESGQLSKYFPIDVVNLDFCGQGFVFPDLRSSPTRRSEYQRRWDCIKACFDCNKAAGKGIWYLLLTLACNRNNRAGEQYLLSQVEELRELTEIDKQAHQWSVNRLIQEVVPKIIADEALQRDYIPSGSAFRSYRYVQAGHSYQMASWCFRFDRDDARRLGRAVTKRQKALKEFCSGYYKEDAPELVL
jgi:hypothetical protein